MSIGHQDHVLIVYSSMEHVNWTGHGCSLPRPLLAVPNVTVHPSTASLPIIALLYNGPLLCVFNVGIKWLNEPVVCVTVVARNRDTGVPVEGSDDLQTLICVLAVRLRRCLILSNPVVWQSLMAAYPGCTLQMKTLFCGWPVMIHDMHTRRRLW